MADYILAMGGYDGHDYTNTVDVFKATANGVEAVQNHGLTLSAARVHLATASCGEYVLAMGGSGGSGAYTNKVDVFKVTDNGIEHITDHGLTLSIARTRLTAASCGEYVLAMGGLNNGGALNAVDVFQVTANGVERITGHGLYLDEPRSFLSSASCGEYVLAMGGSDYSGSALNTVEVFKVTESGIEHITDHGLTLSQARRQFATATCGSYILAMGGSTNSDRSNVVDVFRVTANGVEAVPDHGLSLSVARQNLSSASCGEYVLAMGGGTGSGGSIDANTVDVFKVTTNGVEAVQNHGLSLSVARQDLSSASCGNYILAMGGAITGGVSHRSDAVDVFQVL